ncbi:NAD-dependent epimerase/dehydratase family protein [Paenibacillus tepidiphilus]|uniref:NAD-dependent epimerase/dehydratase family protein n=1 Tax=Paenibacillus tepidiphilus TaxID=2608683 RepID=UPI001238A530|nr:NAD-dependent epimerase/dehydratase family protein [Paenibacillus tepidiphilus]
MLYSNIYEEDVENTLKLCIPWSELTNKTVLITGATGLICSFLVDVLMYRNEIYKSNIRVIITARNQIKAEKRFDRYIKNKKFIILEQNVGEFFSIKDTSIDYIIHGASNADPLSFSNDPIGTMLANINGMNNLLKYALSQNKVRTLFLSTGEVYGENLGNVVNLSEDSYGYINPTNPRSCYPESKRAAETLCASYVKQHQLDVVVARLCHVYGPTMLKTDSRVIAQFIRSAVSGNDIVLKSKGLQKRSYCYVSDAVGAILSILLVGESGQAYNISNNSTGVSIRELAETIAKMYSLKIINEIPESSEKAGYSIINNAILNSTKIELLGWKAQIKLEEGISKTVEILKDLY